MTDDEILKRAAEIMIARRDPDKVRATGKRNIEGYNRERKERGISEETRKKLRDAQAARRERERLGREAAGEDEGK